jgi:hypothetical protein
MQTEQSKHDAVNETIIPEQLLKNIDYFHRKELHKTIDDFFFIGGASCPVSNLLDLVQNLFNGVDSIDNEELAEDGKPKRLYQLYSPDTLSDNLFMTFQLIRFLTKLQEDFERSPDNPRNIRLNSKSQD